MPVFEPEGANIVKNASVVMHQFQSGKAEWKTTSDLSKLTSDPVADDMTRVAVIKGEYSGFSGHTLNIRMIDLPTAETQTDIIEKLLEQV